MGNPQPSDNRRWKDPERLTRSASGMRFGAQWGLDDDRPLRTDLRPGHRE